jgi:peptidoglycan hydrolase-like protein with peptidoglycan-binding domain
MQEIYTIRALSKQKSWLIVFTFLFAFSSIFLSPAEALAHSKNKRAKARATKQKARPKRNAKSSPKAAAKTKTGTKTAAKADPKNPAKPKRETPLNTREIREAEQRLADLGYWAGKIDGKFDEVTRHALIAFQKVTGRPRTGKLTRSERSAIQRSERPEPREGGPSHLEIDLIRQVLFVVDGEGVVTKVLPVSTGSGKDFIAEGYERTATTPPGRFSIMNKIPGWKKSALGRLYYPNYIIGGIAIHGYQSVPAKPASHGCIRIPMFAAIEIYKSAPVGMSVIVHDGTTPAIQTVTPVSHED